MQSLQSETDLWHKCRKLPQYLPLWRVLKRKGRHGEDNEGRMRGVTPSHSPSLPSPGNVLWSGREGRNNKAPSSNWEHLNLPPPLTQTQTIRNQLNQTTELGLHIQCIRHTQAYNNSWATFLQSKQMWLVQKEITSHNLHREQIQIHL